MKAPSRNLVSVIIPCYNQAAFLGAAIESVLSQTCRHFEIIVINDGSTDDTAAVAARYAEVRYFHQPNQGRSSARNFGVRMCRGNYLVFLDADDALTPNALADGLECFSRHPGSAFVYGRYRLMAADGSLYPEIPWFDPRATNYQSFLRRNCVGMIAAVMYRRRVFEAVSGFDCHRHGCEDYDLYLRITRTHPVACHDNFVALYRQHDTNTSRNSSFMLKTALSALSAQKPYLRHPRYVEAWRAGVCFWLDNYAERLMADLRADGASVRTWPNAWSHLLLALRYYPDRLFGKLGRKLKSIVRAEWLTPAGATSKRMTSLSGRK
jgi:glycosyltransferase involved in cell wall biosynthesis